MNSRNLKLLGLGPQNVVPAVDGGKESIFGALGALASAFNVSYVYPGQTDSAIDAGYRKIGVRAMAVDYLPSESISLILRATLQGRPYKFEKYSNESSARAIDQMLGDERFDVILCFHSHMFRLAELLCRIRGWKIPIVLREHNIEYALVASYRSSLPVFLRPVAGVFETLTRREEYRAWQRADSVAFITDADLDEARKSGVKGHFLHAPEGTPLPSLDGQVEVLARLVLLLNPRATQSVASMKRFLWECWLPLVDRGQLAGVGLAVTGVDSDRLESLSGMTPERQRATRIDALGFLPELAPTLRSALALVSPTYVGGGIRKKILEGMAHSVPVLATGLDVRSCGYFRSGDNILEFDDAAVFGQHVTRLMTDPAWRDRIARSGRETVVRYASWDRFGQVLLQEFERIGVGRPIPSECPH